MQLLPARPADFRALREGRFAAARVPEGGLEPEDTLRMLEAWAARLQDAQGWGHWLAIEGGEVVASLAVKDRMEAGRVEIGYAVAPARRGRGVAGRALAALLPVLAALGVSEVLAETAEGNAASGGVLRKTGFAECGRRNDPEDGPVVLWRRGLGPGSAS